MKRECFFSLLCCLLSLFFFLATSQAIAADDSPPLKNAPTSGNDSSVDLQEVQRGVQSSVSEMLSITGSVLSGMSAGMREGAQQIQEQLDGADGTRLVANKKDLTDLLEVSVLRTEKGDDSGTWRVILAITNKNDTPIRLVNLTTKQSVLLLDTEGFAYEPKPDVERKRTLTVAAKTAVKATFDFTGLEGKPKLFRLFDSDIPIQDPPLKAKNETVL